MNKKSLHEMIEILGSSQADFEIIHHDKPILTVKDAENIFDISKSAPVIIIKCDSVYYAYIKSLDQKKIDFEYVKSILSLEEVSLANKQEVYDITGYSIGDIPLIGLPINYIIDKKLLLLDFVYGGIGDANYTLKISPSDLININHVTIFI